MNRPRLQGRPAPQTSAAPQCLSEGLASPPRLSPALPHRPTYGHWYRFERFPSALLNTDSSLNPFLNNPIVVFYNLFERTFISFLWRASLSVLLLIQIYLHAGVIAARSLHVDDGADEVVHLHCVGNELQNLLRGLVCHRTLIDGARSY